jgi:hypothetical protein
MVNADEIAETLNGLDISNPDDNATFDRVAETAKKNGIAIITGYSDDIVSVHGSSHEETGVYDGGIIHLKELITNATKSIDVGWCRNGASWDIVPIDFKASPFIMLEDGEPWCHGICFLEKSVIGVPSLVVNDLPWSDDKSLLVEGDAYLVETKHGIIEGICDVAATAEFCGYYWRDMQWFGRRWVGLDR